MSVHSRGAVTELRIATRCTGTGMPFVTVYEEWGHNQWFARRVEPPEIFTDSSANSSNDTTTHRSQWLTRLRHWADADPRHEDVSNPRLIGATFQIGQDYPGCPYCGSPGFVQCSICSHLSCWDQSPYIWCPWHGCPGGGQVGGEGSQPLKLDGQITQPRRPDLSRLQLPNAERELPDYGRDDFFDA